MSQEFAGPLDPGGPVLLIGAGKMGGALLDGWLARGLDPKLVAVIDPGLSDDAAGALRAKGATVAPPPGGIAAPAAILFAVKPQMAATALPTAADFAGPETVLISILAGTTLATLAASLPAGAAVIRAMPNTPAAVGRGITVCVPGPNVTAAQKSLADALLQASGQIEWVADEALIDAVTGVSGSGPAYVFLLVEALARAGVAEGLPAALAMTLARATVEGAGELLFRSSEIAPETLRKNVTSPNGTTAAALAVLMADDGLDPLIARAVAAAANRARELGG